MEVFIITFILMSLFFIVLVINKFVSQKGRHAFADQKKRSRKMKRVKEYPENYNPKF